MLNFQLWFSKFKLKFIFVILFIEEIMKNSPNTEAFYSKLKIQLEKATSWPSKYLYKFIVKTDLQQIEKVKSLFNDKKAVIKTKPSKNGKYTSISISLNMKDPDAVILKYIEVTNTIEGIISL